MDVANQAKKDKIKKRSDQTRVATQVRQSNALE